jgi:hypothetical protein
MPTKCLQNENKMQKMPNVPVGQKIDRAGNSQGGSITVPLTSCLTGLD